MRWSLIAAAALALSGCADAPIGPDVTSDLLAKKGGGGSGASVYTVEVTPSTAEVAVGATVQLTAIAKDRKGNILPDVSFSWSSSAPAIASVSATDGLVTGVAAGGPVTITAATGGRKPKTGTAHVTVVAPAGTTRQWVGGDAGGPTDWDNAANWNPTGVPVALDTAVIPTGVASMPLLGSSTAIGRLEVQAQATVGLTGYTLTVWRDAESVGEVIGPGVLAMVGTGGKLAGAFPSVLVTGSVDLVGTVSVLGDLTVRGGSISDRGFLLRLRAAAP